MEEARNPAELEYARRLSDALEALDAVLDDALAELTAPDIDATVSALEAPVRALRDAARAASRDA
jgi:cell division septum initiation protein DivIVA